MLYQGLPWPSALGYDVMMSLTDVLIVAIFTLLGGGLVLLSTRLKLGGCRPCRERKNPQNPIGPQQ